MQNNRNGAEMNRMGYDNMNGGGQMNMGGNMEMRDNPNMRGYDRDRRGRFTGGMEMNRTYEYSPRNGYDMEGRFPDHRGPEHGGSMNQQGGMGSRWSPPYYGEPGMEMTVKISGSQDGRKDFAPEISADYAARTHNTLTLQGTVDAFNEAEITESTIILSSNADFTENLVRKDVEVGADGKFTATFEGLSPQTKYYYMVYVNSDHGAAIATKDVTTNTPPKEQTYIKIALYRGINEPDRAYEVKVDFGSKLVVNSTIMSKPGYTFEGWYYDAEFTKPYDMETVIEKGTAPFSLYAKWIEN
jgi:uncharacterized repeat protein (TIGR02543 family)